MCKIFFFASGAISPQRPVACQPLFTSFQQCMTLLKATFSKGTMQLLKLVPGQFKHNTDKCLCYKNIGEMCSDLTYTTHFIELLQQLFKLCCTYRSHRAFYCATKIHVPIIGLMSSQIQSHHVLPQRSLHCFIVFGQTLERPCLAKTCQPGRNLTARLLNFLLFKWHKTLYVSSLYTVEPNKFSPWPSLTLDGAECSNDKRTPLIHWQILMII